MFGQRYVVHNSQWKQVVTSYVGYNNEWKPQLIKLRGINGRWVEIYDSEPPNPLTSIRLDTISYRAGYPTQGNLVFKGYNLSRLVLPEPRDYAHYPLLSNFTDALENFGNCVPFNSPTFSALDGGSLVLNPSLSQYFTLPTTGSSRYDALALLGSTGKSMFLCVVHVYLESLSSAPATETNLMFIGSNNRHVYLSVRQDGSVVFGWYVYGDKVEVELSDAVTTGEWVGLLIKFVPSSTRGQGTLTLKSNSGDSVTQTLSVPFFTPGSTDPVRLGRTDTPISIVSGYFDSGNTHTALTIVNSLEITNSTNTYRTAQPGRLMYPNTGSYYIEIENHTSYDMQFGVGEPGASLSGAAATEGWVVSTISGRKFDHQTGGGTFWSSTIPNNSVIGLLLDTNLGRIEVFVNGVSRGFPFPAGSITVPVMFLISGRGNTFTSNVMRATVKLSGFIYPVPGSLPFPDTLIVDNFSSTYLDGRVRRLTVRNAELSSEFVEDSLLDINQVLRVNWRNLLTNQVFDGSDYLLVSREDEIVANVPDIPAGNYAVSIVKANSLTTAEKFFTVTSFTQSTDPLIIDFRTASAQQIHLNFMRAHKQWGGLNGGVIAENVYMNRPEGLRCRALGDLYTGPLRGVDRFGKRTTQATRIGGCVVTKKYYGPGSYRVVAKLPSLTGVVSAFWTFHYEEGYPGSPIHAAHIADGLRESGNTTDGFYTVRNHEIDIEIPTALKTDPDPEVVSYLNGRFNTWRGELRNWDVSESHPDYWTEYIDEWLTHGINVNDGQYHEFRFDWHTSGTPRVEFYIDSVHITTITEQIPDIPGRFWIGLWFPSSPGNRWAGASANFSEQYMDIRSIQILPYASDPVRLISETYPNDVYRDMFSTILDL